MYIQFNQVFRDRVSLPQSESNSNVPTMEDIQYTEAKVLKLLKNLDISKAQGPDELAPRLLKELEEQLAPSLCKLFNLSLSSGTLPDDWQRANICLLYKRVTNRTLVIIALYLLRQLHAGLRTYNL